jgi:hypothetical protein
VWYRKRCAKAVEPVHDYTPWQRVFAYDDERLVLRRPPNILHVQLDKPAVEDPPRYHIIGNCLPANLSDHAPFANELIQQATRNR